MLYSVFKLSFYQLIQLTMEASILIFWLLYKNAVNSDTMSFPAPISDFWGKYFFSLNSLFYLRYNNEVKWVANDVSCFAIFKRIQSRISLVKEEYAKRSFISDIWLCEKFTSCGKKRRKEKWTVCEISVKKHWRKDNLESFK